MSALLPPILISCLIVSCVSSCAGTELIPIERERLLVPDPSEQLFNRLPAASQTSLSSANNQPLLRNKSFPDHQLSRAPVFGSCDLLPGSRPARPADEDVTTAAGRSLPGPDQRRTIWQADTSYYRRARESWANRAPPPYWNQAVTSSGLFIDCVLHRCDHHCRR